MSKERIELNDTIQSAIAKICENNPGALHVCCSMASQGAVIDPDSALGGFGNILALDTHGIYGPKVWMLYKDVCKEDLTTTIAVLRAVQLGILPESQLLHAIVSRGEGINLDDVLASVRERLPKFGIAEAARKEA